MLFNQAFVVVDIFTQMKVGTPPTLKRDDHDTPAPKEPTPQQYIFISLAYITFHVKQNTYNTSDLIKTIYGTKNQVPNANKILLKEDKKLETHIYVRHE